MLFHLLSRKLHSGFELVSRNVMPYALAWLCAIGICSGCGSKSTEPLVSNDSAPTPPLPTIAIDTVGLNMGFRESDSTESWRPSGAKELSTARSEFANAIRAENDGSTDAAQRFVNAGYRLVDQVSQPDKLDCESKAFASYALLRQAAEFASTGYAEDASAALADAVAFGLHDQNLIDSFPSLLELDGLDEIRLDMQRIHPQLVYEEVQQAFEQAKVYNVSFAMKMEFTTVDQEPFNFESKRRDLNLVINLGSWNSVSMLMYENIRAVIENLPVGKSTVILAPFETMKKRNNYEAFLAAVDDTPPNVHVALGAYATRFEPVVTIDVPSVSFLDKEGQLVAHANGYRSPDTIQAIIDRIGSGPKSDATTLY